LQRRSPWNAIMADQYTPRPEDKFSFGLWTVANRGRDPFGDVVRPVLSPGEAVAMLADVGAWGVNLHDNDLVPIDATPAERDRIVKEFKCACERHHLVVPMATVNLFFDPVFRDGAFTANDARVRAYAVQKTMQAMDLGAGTGAKIFVLWGGREGTETDACRRPDEAIKRLREAVNYLCAYDRSPKHGSSSRWRPSPTSRAATSIWRPRARTSVSSPVWIIRRWSASIQRSRTSRWPGSTSSTPWRKHGKPASCSTSI
jgi:xylose isomerase